MRIDQHRERVLRVTRDSLGLWEVREGGFERPLSSFESMQDARDYADGIARAEPETVVEVYSEDGRLQSRLSAYG